MSTYSERVNLEEVVLFCDKHGKLTGEVGPKLDSHNADTKMHLAFSVYVFNPQGQLLVTQRAHTKKVWPGVWTNSCCGHLALGETARDAAERRLMYELGMKVRDFQVIIPVYTYKTPAFNEVIEHEYCPILIATTDDEPNLNPDEVENYKWVAWQEFVDQAEADGSDYSNPQSETTPIWSWWCKDQLKLLKTNQKFQNFLR